MDKFPGYTDEQLMERLRARHDELGSLQSSYWAIIRNKKLNNRNELIRAISRRQINITSGNIRIENELDRRRGRNLGDVFDGDVLKRNGILTR